MFKTHEFPAPHGNKGVFLVRDGRAVAWSLFRSQTRREMFSGTPDEFMAKFIAGTASVYGSWFEHTRQWIRHTESPARSWVTIGYQSLTSNPEAALDLVLRHLERPVNKTRIKNAITGAHIAKVRGAETSAKQFKKLNDHGAKPIAGEGAVNGWRGQFSDALLEEFDAKLKSLKTDIGEPWIQDVKHV